MRKARIAELFTACAMAVAAPCMYGQNSNERGPPKHATVTRQAAAMARQMTEPVAVRMDQQGGGGPSQQSSVPQGHGISYNSGPVMLGNTNLYYIYYGTWDDGSKAILEDFARNVSGSPYANIAASYYDGNLNRVPSSVNLAGTATDYYSQGSTNVIPLNVVNNAITSGMLPADQNGLYFVLTSPDVSVPSFLTSECGFHGSTHVPVNGTDIPITYAFVGNAGSNTACSAQTTVSPNGNPGVDAMINIAAHELFEAKTNPYGNAWFASNGNEMADACQWNFGKTSTAWNGSLYNVTLGNHQYLLQQLWVNDSDGYCGLQWPASVPSNTWFNIVSKASGLCADVPSWPGDRNGQQPGTQLQEWYCWNGPMQKFRFDSVGAGYEITVQNSGQQWDVAGGPGAISDSTPVIQWPFWGGSNEIWAVSAPDPQGYVTISAFNSARTLDAVSTPQTNYALSAGTLLQQYTYWGGSNQKWMLVPADPMSPDLAAGAGNNTADQPVATPARPQASVLLPSLNHGRQ